ncbi:hypothetical protein D8674_011235 [Pyrus ussuriensis x Pyrus communis]|uniref:Uncharacterized protein n=1 Tax=Pyrus ussuriensis x Pyrus communis TaxID=2448454 RepID=A0A5N5GB28_9ROSA|nr:hypothetical protein D8674_011062 [Pyrus ussuriensis x Pyrus communis]KAB2608067.1 hypothetical protein D8674_011235 [Pyrus ussuriensis x Pyrus communis]
MSNSSMFNNSRSSAHNSRIAEENDSFKVYVSSPEPLRWAPLACDDDSITDNSRTATPSAQKYLHFMGMAGDCNPKMTGVGFGSGAGDGGDCGSKKNNRVHDDNDDAEADRHNKKGKYVDVNNDLKVEMPNVTLSLAIGSGDMQASGSGLDWIRGGNGKISTSKTEELDLNLKPQ